MRLRPYIHSLDFDKIKTWAADRRTHALWSADRTEYPLREDTFREFLAAIAEKHGISRGKIILDPGVGFAKDLPNNLEAVDRIDELRSRTGYPVLLGASRKSFIGLTLELPCEERLEGTIASTVVGVMKGASFIRVHDIKENLRAVRMTQAIMKGYRRG